MVIIYTLFLESHASHNILDSITLLYFKSKCHLLVEGGDFKNKSSNYKCKFCTYLLLIIIIHVPCHGASCPMVLSKPTGTARMYI